MVIKKALLAILFCSQVYADCPVCSNQTTSTTTPLSGDALPFQITLEQADFSLTNGLHSFAFATYKGEWLLLTGRTNGLHDVDNMDPTENSFPLPMQNQVIYVVNPKTKAIYSRSILDPSAELSEEQIDLLSVCNSIFYQSQDKKTLYVVGGYGMNSATQIMGTKAALTAIDVPKLIKWVKNPDGKSARKCLRFAFDPLLQVTGGEMWQVNTHEPFLLIFGQNFDGFYYQTSEGSYSKQVRPCQILDNGKDLLVQPYNQPVPVAEFRRRDLNVVPIVKKEGQGYSFGFVALSGVFTPGGVQDTPGAWTIPIEIQSDGSAKMLDGSFAQGMNNYSCPNLGLYSQKNGSMYSVLFGGISAVISIGAGDCNSECQAPIPTSGPNLTACCNLPFVNDITTIEITKEGGYRQYLMSEKFPVIQSPLTVDPCTGDPLTDPRHLYFGASGVFIPNDDLPSYPNGVIALDKLGSTPIFLGYIVGGIATSLTDTNCLADSNASTYIFKVMLNK